MKAFISRLVAQGHEVWLIGSQVNPAGKSPSDWDFLIFGDEDALADLSKVEPIPGCDPMVVYDGDHFKKPWAQSDRGQDSGSLSNWGWKKISDRAATYRGTKWPDDWGEEKSAIRVDCLGE